MEDTFKECIKLRILRVLIAAVLCFPFHKAVFTGSDCTCTVFRKVAHNADGIIDKHRWNSMHIIPDLRIGFGSIGFLTGGRFQLHQRHRQAVDEQQDIRTFFRVFNIRPLIRHNKGVVVNVRIINKIAKSRAFLALFGITHLYTVLQIIHKHSIFLHQLAVLIICQLVKRVGNGVVRKRRIQPV